MRRFRPTLIGFLVASAFLGAAPCRPAGGADRAVVRLLPLRNVKIDDAFWAPRLRVYREKTIPHSWQYVAGEVRALKRAAGLPVEGDPNGTWGEANLYKFMETCAYALAMFPDARLEQRMDEIIALAAKAQRPDGYVHAYIINAGKPPWDPAFLDGSHDGYVLGHMIEAALEYSAATGKGEFLRVARKAAEEAWNQFLGPRGTPGFCGHAELEMALVELHRAAPDPRYLDLARAFIEWRGRGKVRPVGDTPRAYFQDQVPLRRQKSLDGHAVRAVFFATGVADVAVETGDVDYRLAANRFWDSVTLRRMYVTGSVGPRKEHEAFGEDYELPNDGYCESCGACGLADLAQRMFLLERQAGCADVLERVLYNAVLHGISLDGTTTYYQNPLSHRDTPRYNSWVCCPPNLSRTLLQIGRYAYAFDDGAIHVNLFVGGEFTFPMQPDPVRLTVRTGYPWDGQIAIEVAPPSPRLLRLCLRIPSWCPKAELKVNGERIDPLPLADSGYAVVERTWRAGDVVRLALEMPVRRFEAHPNVKACAGKVAIQRGPLVYAFEGLDNGGNVNVELGRDPGFKTEHRADLLGGITVVTGKTADGRPFTAIPFYALANRDKSCQEVWVTQRGMKPDTPWWLGRLYRPLEPDRLAD